MVHKQEGADKLHNSDMCGIQWDMSPDRHCGATPRYPAEQVPSSSKPSNGRQSSMPHLQRNDKYHLKMDQ